MPAHEIPMWIDRFVAALEKLRGDSKTPPDLRSLAALRRGLTDHPGQAEIWAFARLPPLRPPAEKLALLVAYVFAKHPKEGGKGTLGSAFKAVADRERMKVSKQPHEDVVNVTRRFALVLDAHPDDFPIRLPQTVSFLKSGEEAIDWRQLLFDLTRWTYPGRPVQRNWARDYWYLGHFKDSNTSGEPPTEETADPHYSGNKS